MSQHKSTWRRAGVIGIGGIAAISLVACSGGSGGSGDAGGGDTENATSGDITWWGWTPDQTVATQMIDAFNEEYPDINVEFVSKPIDGYDSVIGPAITSSDGPDVFNVGPGSTNGGVATFGAGAIDLAPAAEEILGADWNSKLAPSGVEGLSVDGKLVGLPAGAVYAGSIWINKDLFDEHDLEPPTTLDEWHAVCEAFEAEGQGCFVQGAGQAAFDMDTYEAIMENIEPGAYQKATVGEMSFTDPIFAEGLEVFKGLFDDGIMQEGAIGLQQYPDANNAFMAGDYAMIMMGSWYTQYTTTDVMTAAIEAAGVGNPEPFTMIPIQFPDVTGTGNVDSMFGDADYGFAVSGKSDQQAAATTFATWLALTEDGQQAIANTLNNVPSLIGVEPNWDEIDFVDPEAQTEVLKEYTATAASSTEPRFGTIKAGLNTAIQDALIAAVTEDMTIDGALEHIQTEFESN